MDKRLELEICSSGAGLTQFPRQDKFTETPRRAICYIQAEVPPSRARHSESNNDGDSTSKLRTIECCSDRYDHESKVYIYILSVLSRQLVVDLRFDRVKLLDANGAACTGSD